MPSKVVLKIKSGSLKDKEFVYDRREKLVLGRADDCTVRFGDDSVSRYHCHVDINPPMVLVRDFGSLNGTFLNGEKIGQRDPSLSPEEAQQLECTEFQMKSGDSLCLGTSCEIILNIAKAVVCTECQCEIEEVKFKNDANQPLCEKCYKEQEKKKRKQQIEALRREEEAHKQNGNRNGHATAVEDEKESDPANTAENPEVGQPKNGESEKGQPVVENPVEKKPIIENPVEEKPNGNAAPKVSSKKNKCAVCEEPLDKGANGTNICTACRNNPAKLLMHLFLQARKKRDDAGEVAGYRNIKLLGKGGMGQVWLVEEEKTGEKMALKIMLPEVARDALSEKMFMREACIGCALEHENVVRHHKCGRSGDMFFILMELCRGGSVDKLMEAKDGSLGRNEKDIACATSITLQILDGLYYTHNATAPVRLKDGSTITQKGVVHRDFKPGNIFIANDDPARPLAKVADFGLAKVFDAAGYTDSTKQGDIRGTIVFMPRQQILDCRYAKPDVDAWAAAASYYNMLTGLFPKDIRGRNSAELIREVLTKDAVPIRRRNSAIPDKLAKVIDTALVDGSEIGIHKLIREYGRKSDRKHAEAFVLKKMIWEALSSNWQKQVWDILPASTRKDIER
ncbi:MAG: protein kinase [Tannerella sp.]|jgi:serine/threonine-protein kinase|nr:protein kinase [Tannerella sp.]